MHDSIILVLKDVAYVLTIDPFDYVFGATIVASIIGLIKKITT